MRYVYQTENTYSYLSIWVFSLFVLVLCSGCAEESHEPYKVGYIGCLTGKCSDLGQSGRDGVIFAVEEINSRGGITDAKGTQKKIELIVVTSQGGEDTAINNFRDLVSQGVVAVICPMTSQVGVTLKSEADTTETVLISPTVSTTELSKQEDYFFRVYQTSDIAAPALAKYATEIDKIKTFAIAYDETNIAFVNPWIEYFRKGVAENGGEIVGIQPLHETLPMLRYAKRINSMEADGVLVIASAYTTGLFIQQLHKLGSKAQILGTEWSTTKSLPGFSGRALDGAYFISSFDETNHTTRHLDFEQSYSKRFLVAPGFAPKFSYEALSLLAMALSKQTNTANLRETLTTLGSVPGLQDDIKLDRYGDIERRIYIKQYREDHFVDVAQFLNGKLKVIKQP